MNHPGVEEIARAVLYEGYLLYPYRASAAKNTYPETFGTLYPAESPCVRDGFERAHLRAQCLLEDGSRAAVEVRLRFLLRTGDGPSPRSWSAAVERQAAVRLELDRSPADRIEGFSFDGECRCEVSLSAHSAAEGIHRLTARVTNRSDQPQTRMASAHLIVTAGAGRFVSLIDPPPRLRSAAAECRNEGVWPVLAGDPGSARAMLCAPIILYDYPRVAPESPGDAFDATEIDELLTLRIRTLTDAEQHEIARSDERARALLERSSAMTPEALLRLHGTFRAPPRAFAPGDRVRLRPRPGADALDTLLAGMHATVVSIEHDYEGRTHLAVVLDADPGRDLGVIGRPGHRFFFKTDEVEPA